MDKRTQKLVLQGIGVAVGGFLFAKFLKQPISGVLDSVGA
jgi:hypothetical protein